MLDPSDPVSMGAMVGPDAFSEVRYLAHYKQLQALEVIPRLSAEFEAQFGRDSGGLLHTYRAEDAQTMVVAMGSVNGTIKDVIDEMRTAGVSIGCTVITSFRPFPLREIHDALQRARRIVVVEKSLAVGLGGNLASNVRMALRGAGIPVLTVIAGLGGRPITRASLRDLFERAGRDELDDTTFLDLRWDVIDREVARMSETRRSGPIAENILRATGTAVKAV
jgi:pyruvate ferredoxin oxidoreductase alpha subunit